MNKIRNAVIVLPIAALITVSYMGWMSREIRPLTSREVVLFELAGSSKRAQELLQALGPEKLGLMEESLYLDFGFLVCYAISIALACNMLPPFTGRPGWIETGKYLSYFALIAGLFDATENVLLLRILHAGDHGWETGIAAACASVKFIIVVLALLFVLFTLWILVKAKKPG